MDYPRYEVVDTIATGDFATVYRGRDRELGREVAIKQIHQQFLHDERQLVRYWQEAQLLASLQHPNILTIYDIVRSRGWLILELMRGSLKPYTQGEPIDLDFLRVALVGSLGALHFLHGNGVIHGDVTPGNLLLDAQQRVKLGDFGLARRAASDEGSLLKGTTKYMAPELVSQQFGPVGPASDIYSLGFSAYELLCGAQFETLFPGLAGFGRDRQIAWMMWHAAPDRALPEIGRVLQGVPDDLARVIQRMIVKDQAQRYTSAIEALRDLRPGRSMLPPAEQPPVQADLQQAAKAKRRRVRVLAGTLLAGLLAALAIWLLVPLQKPAGPIAPQATRGLVRDVFLDERKLVLESSEDGKPLEINVRPRDSILINGRASILRDLVRDDRVTIRILKDELGQAIREFRVSRPELSKGRVAEVAAEQGQFTVAVTEGEDKDRRLVLWVPADLKIVLNGKDTIDKRPVALADLQPDDRVVVRHLEEETGRGATELTAERVVTFEGLVRGVDPKKQQITFALGEGDNPELLTLPYVDTCEVTLNGRRIVDQKDLKPTDLRPGDKARVGHDTRIVRVDAYRVLGQA